MEEGEATLVRGSLFIRTSSGAPITRGRARMRHSGYLSGGIAQEIDWICDGESVEIRDHKDGTVVENAAAEQALRSVLREYGELRD